MGKKSGLKTRRKLVRKPNSSLPIESTATALPSLKPKAQNKADRISDLPDEILRLIISRIRSDAYAARARLLSARWRDLWIVHHQSGSIYAMFITLIRFFDRRKPFIDYDCPRKLVFHCDGSGHVLVATMGANRKLHLDFSHGLPVVDDSRNWWASLILMLSYLPAPPHPPNTKFSTIIPPIRSICLTSVGPLSIDIVSSLLSKIPSLKRIEIRRCSGLPCVTVDHTDLKQLSVIDCKVDSLSIISRTLTHLRCRRRCPFMRISLPPHCIKDVMLDFREGPTRMNNPMDLGDLLFIRHAEYITLCQWTVKMMICPDFGLFRWLKELWWIDNSMEKEKISTLCNFLDLCLWLEKLFVTIDPTCYSLPRERAETEAVKRPLWEAGPRHLKLVKMDGFKNEREEMRLARCLSFVSRKELEVIATSRTHCTRRLERDHRNRPWMFVKVKDVDKRYVQFLNAKHKHMNI